MKLSTINRYYHRATPLVMTTPATQTESAVYEDGEPIECNTLTLDRLGFIEVYTKHYYNPEVTRFYNIRNRQGVLLYPYQEEEYGQILGIFNVSARFDAWGNVLYYLYTTRRADG